MHHQVEILMYQILVFLHLSLYHIDVCFVTAFELIIERLQLMIQLRNLICLLICCLNQVLQYVFIELVFLVKILERFFEHLLDLLLERLHSVVHGLGLSSKMFKYLNINKVSDTKLVQYYQSPGYMQKTKLTFLIIIMFGLIQASFCEQPTNFDYKDHGANWPDACSDDTLHNQSPINLMRGIDSDKQSYLFADFRTVEANVTIYNTTILITPKNSGERFGQIYSETYKQSHYSFKATQIRIRCGSEHRVQQQDKTFKQYDLEVQIHTFPLIGPQNDKLVIGLLFEVSDTSDPFLEQIIKGSVNKQLNQTFTINAELSHLLYRQLIFNFWFYLGSLTYPPCRNKGMNWIIPDKVYKISQTQLDFFRKFYPIGNWRGVKSFNEKEIGYAKALPSEDNIL